jgi:hypothetical protein
VSVAVDPTPLAPVLPLPVLRLLPAPCCEPPYDDELPLEARAPGPAAVVPLRLVDAPTAAPAPGRDVTEAPRPSTPRDLPPSGPFAHALVLRLLEVLAGLRPLSQLQRDTSFELFEALEHQVPRRVRTTGVRPTRRDVRSVHVQEREDGVAEGCATVHRGGRVTALAFRLEGASGAWRCTELLGV